MCADIPPPERSSRGGGFDPVGEGLAAAVVLGQLSPCYVLGSWNAVAAGTHVAVLGAIRGCKLLAGSAMPFKDFGLPFERHSGAIIAAMTACWARAVSSVSICGAGLFPSWPAALIYKQSWHTQANNRWRFGCCLPTRCLRPSRALQDTKMPAFPGAGWAEGYPAAEQEERAHEDSLASAPPTDVEEVAEAVKVRQGSAITRPAVRLEVGWRYPSPPVGDTAAVPTTLLMLPCRWWCAYGRRCHVSSTASDPLRMPCLWTPPATL